jgi:hypothetical protein
MPLTALRGSLYITRPSLMPHTEKRENLLEIAGELMKMVSSGKVKIEIEQRFRLADAAQAAPRSGRPQDHGLDGAALMQMAVPPVAAVSGIGLAGAVPPDPARRFGGVARVYGGAGLARLPTPPMSS